MADNTARLVFAKALAFPKAAHDDDNDDDTTCRDSNTTDKQTKLQA